MSPTRTIAAVVLLLGTAAAGRADIVNPHGEVAVSALRGDLVLEASYESVAVDGVPVSPIGNTVAVRLGVGASLYF